MVSRRVKKKLFNDTDAIPVIIIRLVTSRVQGVFLNFILMRGIFHFWKL